MFDFQHFYRYAAGAVLSIAALATVSCRKDLPSPTGDELGAVTVQIALPTLTRAFVDDASHHVNRILVLPFRKSAEGLSDDNANYLPVYTYARQIDADRFPLSSATLHLPVEVSYKVLVIGYNRADYDFNDRNNPANRFDLGALSSPVTLAGFHLFPKSPVAVPEFFTCLVSAYSGGTLVGAVFRPEQGYTLKGELKRLVSGFSVTITDVPAFVKSITLSAENLVKSSRALDAAATQWQTAGDGGTRVLAKQTPAGGTVTFSQYLLPTFATYKTGFSLAVELGSVSETYAVKAADGAVVSDNRFIFNPNEAINLTGSYAAINLGFNISYGINLDDDLWDGIQ